MATINQTKQLAEADTPLLFFDCLLPSGVLEFWSTHSLQFNGQVYSARILKHNLFELQLSADDAMDGVSQLSISLANADSKMSELNAAGFKGSQLTVHFAFADLAASVVSSDSTVLFRGVSGDPEEIGEDYLNLSFTNKLNLQRIPVPDVRIQRSCPWNFPSSSAQRAEALDGGANGRFSRFYRCGYSADIAGGLGSLNGSQAFTSCDKSRSQCQQRGMFSIDAASNSTRSFGGLEFVPSAIMVRGSSDKTSHLSPLLDNTAKYNDPAPIVYGTGWLKAPVIFARNDGNLTHMEALLGLGVVDAVLKVVVNNVEIPQGVAGQDMTVTGWYSVVATGTRQGNFNYDFADSNRNPLGDPHGSLATLSVVVPNRISSGKAMPNVEVLMRGVKVDTFDANAVLQPPSYSNNPAWVILDVLRRSGWSLSDLDINSFISASNFCGYLISSTDLNGNAIEVPRYQCNLILTKRQSAATVVRGIRVASSLMLRYGPSGLLELTPETTLAAQQPTLPDGGNSLQPIQGGWPAYEFSDGTDTFSGIVRNPNGSSTVRLISHSVSESSNRLSVEFQDESNEFQQDSLSLVDSEDAALIGYEISSASTALGIANFSQAQRVLLRQLDKSIEGNFFVQFVTSFRALKVRPGDIIALTYAKEFLERALFRVTKLSPSTNYELVTILAQFHDDDWYSDNPAILGGAGRQPTSAIQGPRPLIGLIPHYDASGNFEFFDFQVRETVQALLDGTATDTLSVAFSVPNKPSANSLSLPLLSFSPAYSTGGTLPGGSAFYYAVTALDASGNEGALSFTVPAMTSDGPDNNSISIQGLSFPATTAACNVYRGSSPQLLYRIASNISIASIVAAGNSFTDAGSAFQPIGPPDSSFDHANFYYRYEYAGPFPTTVFSANTIGWDDMGAVKDAYAGMVVRIVQGTGQSQERSISGNDATTLTVSPAWSVIPSPASIFSIAEASWKFAAVSATSPAQFEVPYNTGAVIQISGRAANVSDQESNPDLCPLTRQVLGGGKTDFGMPGTPGFTLAAPGGGELVLSQVGFQDLANTASVFSGTLQVFHWNELAEASSSSLVTGLDASTSVVQLAAASATNIGQQIQIGAELMTVLSLGLAPNTYSVLRGAVGSLPAAHSPQDPVLFLDSSVVVVPFAANFFQNRASSNYLHTLSLPDVRITAAQFFVTNAFGQSQINQICYAALPALGLRTLSGGQFSLQVGGYLATQQNSAPPLIVEASHAVRDIRATMNQPASGYDVVVQILQNGALFAQLKILSGQSTSESIVDGLTVPPLVEGATLSLNLALNVITPPPTLLSPGRDLTATIRL